MGFKIKSNAWYLIACAWSDSKQMYFLAPRLGAALNIIQRNMISPQISLQILKRSLVLGSLSAQIWSFSYLETPIFHSLEKSFPSPLFQIICSHINITLKQIHRKTEKCSLEIESIFLNKQIQGISVYFGAKNCVNITYIVTYLRIDFPLSRTTVYV